MELISQDKFENLLVQHGISSKTLRNFINKFLGVKEINSIYTNFKGFSRFETINKMFEKFGNDIDYEEKDLYKIPEKGPFCVISNHPMGIWDGMILLKMIRPIRPDFKIVANYLLESDSQAYDFIIPVDSKGNSSSNLKVVKQILNHIEDGKSFGIFPSGKVASFSLNKLRIKERKWNTTCHKLLMKLDIPVIQVNITAQNSLVFYFLSVLHPNLGMLMLVKEFLNKRNQRFHVDISNSTELFAR